MSLTHFLGRIMTGRVASPPVSIVASGSGRTDAVVMPAKGSRRRCGEADLEFGTGGAWAKRIGLCTLG